ncbi:MAG: hypothetical protein M3275_07925 [Thermoproteota archaeon]|nr:hypothetical protein [Thermoproteota archaeon]
MTHSIAPAVLNYAQQTMKKKVVIRDISDIVMNTSLKQEEGKEQFRVTSTGTPAENKEEEEAKEKKEKKKKKERTTTK